MRTRNSRFFCWVMFLSLLVALSSGLSAASAQDDAADSEGVAPYREASRLQQSIFGPDRGTLVHDADTIAFAPAGVSVRNFYAKARVVAPYDGADKTWDAGFSFRFGRDLDWRLAVYSNGAWDVRLGAGEPIASGAVDNLEIAEGDANDIEIAIDGDTGYLAINGDEIDTFDVSRRGVRGDVLLGAGFTDESTDPGAEMRYSRFQVWELDDEGPPPVSRDARDLLEEGRDLADIEEPINGPLSGELAEDSESVPVDSLDVDVSNFYARVEFTNPRDHSDHPFDIGVGFRDAGENQQYRLVIASDGSWYVSLGIQPAIACENFTGLNDQAGDTNLLEVAVSGDTVAFAINGDVIGSASITEVDDPGDIILGAAFYPGEDFVEDGATAYTDFAAWELTGTQPEPTQERETPEPTEELDTPEPGDPEEIFDAYLDDTSSLEIIYGPENGDLEHAADQLTYQPANLDVENFIAHVEFINPYAASDGNWDVGILFRLGDQEPHARLIITSSGDWLLSPSTEDPLDSGSVPDLNLGDGERNAIDLVVVGDTGYFGVNGAFVSELDLSMFDQSGEIAIGTAFFQDSFQEDATTGFEDFLVWEITDDASTPEPTEEATEEPTEEPTAEATEEPTEEATVESSATVTAENLYESPSHGYTIAYNDDWSIDTESSEDGVDYVRLVNGSVTMDFTGFETDITPDECLDGELDFYQTAEGYSDVAVAVDANNEEMRGEVDDYVWGAFWFTFTPEDGDPIDFTSYVECRPFDDGNAMLRIVQFVPFDEYNDSIDARVELLDGLSLEGSSGVATPTEEAGTPEATAEGGDETPEANGESLVVLIEAVGNSEVSGLATVEGEGNRSTVRVLAIGVEDGTVVLIQEGTCDDLSGEPAFLLNEIDGGVSQTSIRVSLDELTGDDFVITIHESNENLAEPLACGQIASLG